MYIPAHTYSQARVHTCPDMLRSLCTNAQRERQRKTSSTFSHMSHHAQCSGFAGVAPLPLPPPALRYALAYIADTSQPILMLPNESIKSTVMLHERTQIDQHVIVASPRNANTFSDTCSFRICIEFKTSELSDTVSKMHASKTTPNRAAHVRYACWLTPSTIKLADTPVPTWAFPTRSGISPRERVCVYVVISMPCRRNQC